MSTTLGISIEAGRVVAAAVRRGQAVWAAEAPYEGPDDLARVLAALAAERPRGVRRAAVSLGGAVSRTRSVAGLPKLRPDDLAAHVRLNTRRYFAQNGVALVTDARPTDEGALLAAAHAPIVEAVAAGLASAGLGCDTIVPVGVLGDLAGVEAAVAVAGERRPALLLVPDTHRAERVERERRQLKGWTITAGVAVILAMLAQLVAPARTERAARRELARLGPAVNAAIAVRRDLDASTTALAALGGAGSGGRYARFLADLTRALPDSAFLATVSLEDAGGRLVGYAPSAAAVVARLERTPRIASARLEGPVTREIVAGRERERFTIVLTMRREPAR